MAYSDQIYSFLDTFYFEAAGAIKEVEEPSSDKSSEGAVRVVPSLSYQGSEQLYLEGRLVPGVDRIAQATVSSENLMDNNGENMEVRL